MENPTMIKVYVTGMSDHDSVAEVVDRLEQIETIDQIMVRLETDEPSVISITGEADEADIREKIGDSATIESIDMDHDPIHTHRN